MRAEEKIKQLEQENRQLKQLISSLQEEQKNEAELLQTAEKYRLLTENIRDVIWSLDTKLNFTYISPSSEKCWVIH